MLEPLLTNFTRLDFIIPVGRGQRELTIGDRQTGKSSICLDIVLNQVLAETGPVHCSLGQKSTAVLEIFSVILRRDACFYLSLATAVASLIPVL